MLRALDLGTLTRRDRRVGQDNMRVGAAEAKRANTGNFLAGLPGDATGGDGQRQFIPGDVGVELLQMQMRRNNPVLDHQHGLDQPGDACG